MAIKERANIRNLSLAFLSSFSLQPLIETSSVANAQKSAEVAAAIAKGKMSDQTILDQIHSIINAHDFVNPGGNGNGGAQFEGHYYPFKIYPTQADLYPSKAGFRTACKDPFISTYRYYETSTIGTTFDTCGPLSPDRQTVVQNQYQSALNKLGKNVATSLGISYKGEVSSVSGTPQTVKVNYDCIANTSEPLLGYAFPIGSITLHSVSAGPYLTRAEIIPCD